MTSEEYVEYVMGIRTQIHDVSRAALPSETEIFNRFILSGQKDGDDWIAPFRNSAGKIRCLIILTNSLPIGSLGGTAGGRVIHSQVKFKFELYHQYRFGKTANLDNSEEDFIKDALRLQFAIGKNRAFGNYAVIENKVEFRLGISPGTFPCHKAMAEILIDLRNVRY